MRSFVSGSMNLLAALITVAVLVAIPVPAAVSLLGPEESSNGNDAASSMVGSGVSMDSALVDESWDWTTREGKPSDKAPKCARAGDAVRLWPVGSTPYGRSYNEWSQDWWRWALSLPPAINPILDTTGDSCGYGQHGPVWFLAGAFGGTVTRSCSVPCDKAIFLPIINQEWENVWVGQPIYTIAELRALIAGAGTPTAVTLEVDGHALPKVGKNRVQSDVFDYALGPDNLGGQPQGIYFPTVSDGIWAMLDPLPPGPHTIRFTALAGDFFLDVTYNLSVVALEVPCSSPPCP